MAIKKPTFVYLGISLAIILFLYLFVQRNARGTTPNKIYDIWYINLARSKERNDSILRETEKLAPFVPNRFEAVDGKVMTDADYNKLNVPAWARPEFAREDRQQIRKGEIGCYLSHRNLLTHLSKQNAPAEMGHLILEDDIIIDQDFLAKWGEYARYLDPNWDIVNFGIYNKKIENVEHNLGKPRWINNNFAYLVKHSSIPKVLEATKSMAEPFDTALARNMDKLNIYAVTPPIVRPRQNNDTTMEGEN